MKKLLFLALFCILASNTFAQEIYGKVFVKEEADKLYGSVLKSYKISALTLSEYLSKTGDYIMFKLGSKDETLAVLSDKRALLFSDRTDKNISASEVFYAYSKSVVQELLNKGQEGTVYIEQREKVMTVTNGNYTMEIARPCPPYCPD